MGIVDTTFSSSSRDSHMTLGWDNPTADPTTTILLRHGDTQLSPEHRFSGLRDLPLSANGIRQAQAAACRLATGVPIDAVGDFLLDTAASQIKRIECRSVIVRKLIESGLQKKECSYGDI